MKIEGSGQDQIELSVGAPLSFEGCIVDLSSDNSENSEMLTDEQTEVLAAIIFQSFKRWYAR